MFGRCRGSTPGQVLLIGQVRLITFICAINRSAINLITRITAPQTAINRTNYAINAINRIFGASNRHVGVRLCD